MAVSRRSHASVTPVSRKSLGDVTPRDLRLETRDRKRIASSAEEALRRFEEHEVAAMAWAALSKFPKERGIAAARWRAFAWKLDPEIAMYALCSLAFDGYHAVLFGEVVARERSARISEVLRESQKKQEAPARRASRGVRSIAEILGAA